MSVLSLIINNTFGPLFFRLSCSALNNEGLRREERCIEDFDYIGFLQTLKTSYISYNQVKTSG